MAMIGTFGLDLLFGTGIIVLGPVERVGLGRLGRSRSRTSRRNNCHYGEPECAIYINERLCPVAIIVTSVNRTVAEAQRCCEMVDAEHLHREKMPKQGTLR